MKNRKGCLPILGLLFLLFLLLGGAGVWLYGRTAQKQPPPFVQIRSPQSGELTGLNETLPLEVYAEAARPILRLEVYADGALVAAANGQTNTLTLIQPWTISTPGRHVLVARAFFAADDFADSQVVFVDTADLSGLPVLVNVDDLPRGEGMTDITVGDLAAAAGTTPEELARLNPGVPALSSAAPDAVIPPGVDVALPRHPNPPPPSAPDVPPPAPGAPGSPGDGSVLARFDGETHSCSQIAVRWTDASDESAYRLYRLTPGEDRMELLATRPANATTYADPFIPRVGAYRYFLAVVRAGGEVITDTLTVEIGPECAPSEGSATLDLRLLRLTTSQSYSGVYCYVSLNGSRYERLPAEPGLLRPTADPLTYDLPLQLPNRGQFSLTAPPDGVMRLSGECWGLQGAESVRIGRFESSHASAEWDGRDLTSDLRAFAPREQAAAGAFPAGDGGAPRLSYRIQPTGARFDLSNLAPGVLRSLYLDLPQTFTPLIGQVSDIPAPTNVAVEWAFGCDPRLYLYDGGGFRCALSVPRLAWSWLPSAAVTQNMLTGFDVKLEFEQPGSPSRREPGPQFRVDGQNRFLPLAPLPLTYRCGVTVYATVSARTTQGNSAPSAPLILRMPECKQDKLRARITSIQLTASNRTAELLDDGDICIACADRRLEVFGAVYLNGYGERHDSLGHDWVHVLFGSCPGSTTCLEEGTYRLGESSTGIPWLFQRDVPHTGSAIFTVSLFDYDINNGPDPLCVGNAEVQLGSLIDRNFRKTLTVSSDFGEAACVVTVEVTIAP